MKVIYSHQEILTMMTSLVFALCLFCFSFWRIALTTDLKSTASVHQDSGFISANIGDNVTLRCTYQTDLPAVFLWYKQTLGQRPRIVSTFHKHDKNGSFSDEFRNNPRFKLETKKNKNHLTITDLRISDSATYYCISCYAYKFEFAEGTVLSVKGSGLNVQTLVHQSASESIQPGGSVTLNCTVHTGSCDGGHRVYWFKQSEEPHPGLIYTHEDGNDQCERKNKTQTHTCEYNLSMKDLNISHAGTYYCAVASCGHILFGDGTNLGLADEVNSADSLVSFLSGALVFATILVVLLAISVCMMNKRNSCQCTESQRVSASTTMPTEGNQDGGSLHYAALKHYKANRSRGQRDNTMSECVYSSVRQ